MKTRKLNLLTRTRALGLLIMIVSVGVSFGTAHAQTCPGPAPQPHQLGDAFTFHAFLAWQGVPIGSPTPRRIALHFRLYDAQQGGSQVGPTLCFRGPDSPGVDPAQCEPGAVLAGTRVLAAEGHVAVALDFGPQFAGENLWLETEIFDDNFLLAWQILSPRPQIGISPYAKYATEVADDTVTVVKLVDQAVCTEKIADDAVTDTKIALNAVTSWQIAPGAVGSSELGNSAVQTAHLGISAVTTSKIADGTIIADDIAAAAVTSSKIQDGTITGSDIDSNTIDSTRLSGSGATNGQVLTASGGAVQWQNLPPSGWTLPVDESFGGSGNAFTITQTGSSGSAGEFVATGSNNGVPALRATHSGQGYAIGAIKNGTSGGAVHVRINDANNGSDALQAYTFGVGRAAKFGVLNASCVREAVHISTAGTGPGAFVQVQNTASNSPALLGQTNSTGLLATGVHGEATATTGFGVGVRGESNASQGAGVVGLATGGHTTLTYGVWGESDSPNGIGVIGRVASGGNGLAVLSDGDCDVNGILSATVKNFKIDHPLDPENKYLIHASIESSDLINIYTGNVVLDGAGEAWVDLPDWFEALNADFRYQLTAVGAPGPNLYVAEEISDNALMIAGGTPGSKVSWTITGVRHDPFAAANPISVEQEKPDYDKGHYRHPEVYGLPAERAIRVLRDGGNEPEELLGARQRDDARGSAGN